MACKKIRDTASFDLKYVESPFNYIDTLNVVVDTTRIIAKLDSLLGSSTAKFTEWHAGVSWAKGTGTNADSVKVTKNDGFTSSDSINIVEEIPKLIKKAYGLASDSAFLAKDYRLNFERVDPFGDWSAAGGPAGGQSEAISIGANFSHIKLKPDYSYTIKVISQAGEEESVGTFTYEAKTEVSFREEDVTEFKPFVFFVGTDGDTSRVEVPGVDEEDMQPGAVSYGDRVDSIWLEATNGQNYAPEYFDADTLNYTVGVARGFYYSLRYSSTSEEPDLTFRTFALGEKYELHVLKAGDLKEKYTVTTYLLDSVSTLKKITLSYDRKGEKIIDSLESVSSVSRIDFRPLKHDTDSVFLHIVRESKLSSFDSIYRNDPAVPAVTDIVHTDTVTTVVKIGSSNQAPGVNMDYKIKVTAKDQGFKDYAVRIVKSFNLLLNTVTFGEKQDSPYPITPEFDGKDSSSLYRVSVPADVKFDKVRVFPVTADRSGQVIYNSVITVEGDVYKYDIKLYVVGVPGEAVYHFQLIHLLPPDSIATLESLTVTPGSLDSEFAPADTFYTVKFEGVQKDVWVVASAKSSATIEGSDEPGYLSKLYSLSENGTDTLSIKVTAEDRKTKQVYRIKVTNGKATGIASVSSAAIALYVTDGDLRVVTPVAERVSVYSVSGNLLHSVSKPAGGISFYSLPKGVFIVKGSSGWVRKVLI